MYLKNPYPTINRARKPPLTVLLSLKYVKNIGCRSCIFRQITLVFVTNIIKLVIMQRKFLLSLGNSLKILKENIYINVKNNAIFFWKYGDNRRTSNVNIPQVRKPNINKKVYFETDYDKAEALAFQVNSIFTIKGESERNIEENIT